MSSDPTITLILIKQPDGTFRIRCDTHNAWSNCGGLVCTKFEIKEGDRIEIVLEPPSKQTTTGH